MPPVSTSIPPLTAYSRPASGISHSNGRLMCEQAAQLIFVNVSWVKSMNANTGLCVEDQLTLLESSWRELFLLAAAQCVPHLDPTPLLPSGIEGVGLAVEVSKFRDILLAFNGLCLNAHEYSCARAIVLYKAGLDNESVPSSRSSTGSASPGCGRLKDTAAVARLRDHAQEALAEKMNVKYSGGAVRFSQLILMLPMLRNVSAQAIEEIFFKNTIGETRIEKILCDVYAKDTT